MNSGWGVGRNSGVLGSNRGRVGCEALLRNPPEILKSKASNDEFETIFGRNMAVFLFLGL